MGGVRGYAAFLHAITDPEHDEHDAMVTWVGGVFDLDGCDVNMVNRQLRRMREQSGSKVIDVC